MPVSRGYMRVLYPLLMAPCRSDTSVDAGCFEFVRRVQWLAQALSWSSVKAQLWSLAVDAVRTVAARYLGIASGVGERELMGDGVIQGLAPTSVNLTTGDYCRAIATCGWDGRAALQRSEVCARQVRNHQLPQPVPISFN